MTVPKHGPEFDPAHGTEYGPAASPEAFREEARRAGTRVWGLTGKYCAGKNLAGQLLEKEGCVIVDVDKLGHRVLDEEKEAIARRFGSGVLGPRGELDRSRLGAIVFADPAALKELEAIVHPAAIARTWEIVLENPGRTVVVNAALLFPAAMYKNCDKVLWITAPVLTRIRRGMSRDGLALSAVLRRIWAQRKLRPQFWRKFADIHTIPNPGKGDVLARGLRNFLEREN